MHILCFLLIVFLFLCNRAFKSSNHSNESIYDKHILTAAEDGKSKFTLMAAQLSQDSHYLVASHNKLGSVSRREGTLPVNTNYFPGSFIPFPDYPEGLNSTCSHSENLDTIFSLQ